MCHFVWQQKKVTLNVLWANVWRNVFKFSIMNGLEHWLAYQKDITCSEASPLRFVYFVVLLNRASFLCLGSFTSLHFWYNYIFSVTRLFCCSPFSLFPKPFSSLSGEAGHKKSGKFHPWCRSIVSQLAQRKSKMEKEEKLHKLTTKCDNIVVVVADWLFSLFFSFSTRKREKRCRYRQQSIKQYVPYYL